MSSGVATERAPTLAAALEPMVSRGLFPLPRGVRLLRNSSDSADSSDGTVTFDRHARLRAAKEELRDFVHPE
jgi:hypothetical protein